MFQFLLIIQTLIAAAMVAIILMQRSEGGGLGVGGSPAGLMSARGAADFLTRATAILAGLFVILSIALAGLATVQRAPIKLDTSLAPPAQTAPGPSPTPTQAPILDPLSGAARQSTGEQGSGQQGAGQQGTGQPGPAAGNQSAPLPPTK
jgi:preprotein translocase subunit SecG